MIWSMSRSVEVWLLPKWYLFAGNVLVDSGEAQNELISAVEDAVDAVTAGDVVWLFGTVTAAIGKRPLLPRRGVTNRAPDRLARLTRLDAGGEFSPSEIFVLPRFAGLLAFGLPARFVE